MKKIKWLIQSSGVNLNLNDELWFSRNVNYIDFGIIEFTNEITNLSNIYQDWLNDSEVIYIMRGATKILKILGTDAIHDNAEILSLDFPNHNFSEFFSSLKKAIFYDHEKFDQAYYQKLDLPLLNKDAISIPTLEAKSMVFDEEKFVKPTSDGKAFVAKILMPGENIEDLILSSRHNPSIWNETILIAPVKKVLKEWRFFVLNGEVITGSQYLENHILKVKELDQSVDDVKAIQVAKEYAKLYSPSNIFTMDICLEENQNWSIVEYNCFNCSGLYKSNLLNLKNVVEEFVLISAEKKNGYKKN